MPGNSRRASAALALSVEMERKNSSSTSAAATSKRARADRDPLRVDRATQHQHDQPRRRASASKSSPARRIVRRLHVLVPLPAAARRARSARWRRCVQARAQEIAPRHCREIHLAAAATALQARPRHEVCARVRDVTPLCAARGRRRDSRRWLTRSEPPDPDPVLLRSDAAPLRRRAVGHALAVSTARRRSSGSRVSQGPVASSRNSRVCGAARVPPTPALLNDTLALYNGLFILSVERRFAPALPPVRIDVSNPPRYHQPRDHAIEQWECPG